MLDCAVHADSWSSRIYMCWRSEYGYGVTTGPAQYLHSAITAHLALTAELLVGARLLLLLDC